MREKKAEEPRPKDPMGGWIGVVQVPPKHFPAEPTYST